jgi:hypothetical protein
VEENREKGKKKIKKEEEMQNCENVDVIKDNDLIKDKKKSKKRTNTYRRLKEIHILTMVGYYCYHFKSKILIGQKYT